MEYEGTYPLPEAQKDRFMLKIPMDCPDRDDELTLARRMLGEDSPEATLAANAVQAVISADDLAMLRAQLEAITVREELLSYVVDVVRTTRSDDSVLVGADRAPRSRCCWQARACAAISGRDYTTPDDVKSMTLPVLGHRIILRPEYEIEGVTVGEVVTKVLEKIAVPR